MIELEIAPAEGSSEGAHASSESHQATHEYHDQIKMPEPASSMFVGWDATPIVCMGVIFPGLTLLALAGTLPEETCGAFLRHPIESIVQFALAVCIPMGNFIAWKRVRLQQCKNAAGTGILNGIAFGGAMLGMVGALAGLLLGYPLASDHAAGFQWVGFVALFSALVSIYLMMQLRGSWETSSARNRQTLYSLFGVFLALFGVAISEGRPTIIRIAEGKAINGTAEEKDGAIDLLRQLNCEKDLRMDIADVRSGGLSGLFLPIDSTMAKDLYFEAVGTPYHDNKGGASSVMDMPDSYLGSHVVGTVIPELSVARSEISGSVNADTLSSSLDWTMVLKNSGWQDREARAEILLPPNAVVSGMTLWENGAPVDATIGSTEQTSGAYHWVVVQHRDPALVTDLGHNRVLMQCYPVGPHKELKVRVSIKAPMRIDSRTQASLTLPRLLASNFSAKGDHTLNLQSKNALSLDIAKSRRVTRATGSQLYVARLTEEDVTKTALSIAATRKPSLGAVAAPELHVQRDATGRVASMQRLGYFVESLKEIQVKAPSHLVVVVDGSEKVKAHVDDIAEALSKWSSDLVPTSVIIANTDHESDLEPVPLQEGIERLRKTSFAGGHNNLPAVIKAAEVAGETNNGAVIWIHGPQPSTNHEIYISSKFFSTPSFYDLPIDDGWTNISEFFQNHRDIGPFTGVSRNGKLQDDLTKFLAQWKPNTKSYKVEFFHMNRQPQNCPIVTGPEVQELAALCAAHEARYFLSLSRNDLAVAVATRNHIVTPVSAGVVLERSSDYEQFGLKPDKAEAESETLADGAPANVRPTDGNEPAVASSSDNFSLSWGAGHRRTRAAGMAMQPLSQPPAAALMPAPPPVPSPDASPTANAAPIEGATFAGAAGSLNTATAIASDSSGGNPILQGAVNGTIGPQGADATYVTGVNTSGAVRVNNLENLECLLQMVANAVQVGSFILAALLLVSVCVNRGYVMVPIVNAGLRRADRIALMCIIFAVGWVTPGMINWMVAAARDANLFN
ncbi:MAG TPA: hypothetical protein V6C81_23960 [Planktothrix sp.]|jgi:hypothetical protein